MGPTVVILNFLVGFIFGIVHQGMADGFPCQDLQASSPMARSGFKGRDEQGAYNRDTEEGAVER